MANNPNLRGTLDNDLLSLTRPHEVRYWMMALYCTEAHLHTAVRAVGNSAQKVRGYLARH